MIRPARPLGAVTGGLPTYRDRPAGPRGCRGPAPMGWRGPGGPRVRKRSFRSDCTPVHSTVSSWAALRLTPGLAGLPCDCLAFRRGSGRCRRLRCRQVHRPGRVRDEDVVHDCVTERPFQQALELGGARRFPETHPPSGVVLRDARENREAGRKVGVAVEFLLPITRSHPAGSRISCMTPRCITISSTCRGEARGVSRSTSKVVTPSAMVKFCRAPGVGPAIQTILAASIFYEKRSRLTCV